VAGLGNPGDRYSGTRHNVGFDVIDALAGRSSGGAKARVDRLDCRALTGRIHIAGRTVLLAKPQTYMNLSGESVKGLATKYEVPPERLLVVVDDVALPVGRIRLRASGSAGGQKGLQNVVECFRTPAVPRLRIGIAGEHFAPGDDRADYVLARFSKTERAAIQAAVEDACDAVEVFVTDGLDAAMSRFNRSQDPPPEDAASTT
jgi:peptidyl-tRNA hydrolase, PTH1 family